MTRYITVIAMLECYHLDYGGKHVSTVIVSDAHRSAGEFAAALRQAAEWFEMVSEHKLKPSPRVKGGA